MQLELEFAVPMPARSSYSESGLTPEQRRAVAARTGDMLLDASAGSGKTSVLVERFARSVVQDGVDVRAILAITFTEKAAAEMRDRIRARLRALRADAEARATEGAVISTIHGFCARVLRAEALAAGLDPQFTVIDEPDVRGLQAAAFDEALAELAAGGPEGTELVASYRPDQLRWAISGTYAELRSRGEREPRLPPLPPRPADAEFDYGYAERVYGLLDRLLRRYGALYTERKRAVSGLDFADLELIVRDLFVSEPSVRDRYAERFERIMVDELQDVNAVQLELIQAISRENLFAVGDALQSIYGFRHADVELFERLGARLEDVGRRATLETNFRSRPEILDVVNAAFAAELGERFRPLRAGRSPSAARNGATRRVELLIVDKCAEWPAEARAATAWRLAEARTLAGRIGELVDSGTAPREIVMLTRATTDMRCYERALEDRGVPTYVIGGRGYWSHPQVIDLIGYLRALANPRDQEALYTVLVSPLVGVSLDALVLLAAAARDASREPWSVLNEDQELLHEVAEGDRERLRGFADWFAAERELAPRASVEELIERALELTGYDLHVLGLPGGERRLANVRKLMRLGHEYTTAHGPNLRGFLEFAHARALAGGGAEESEAPVEGEALDAVRLMTIHRAKGLEFDIVCVADLGRETPRGRSSDVVVVGRDGRVGLRLAWPGTGKAVPVLDHKALCEHYQAAEAAEERRLFYVAMTRARERLILSGAARLEPEGHLVPNDRGAPIGWIARAIAAGGVTPAVIRPAGEREEGPGPPAGPEVTEPRIPPQDPMPAQLEERPLASPAPLAVPALSYSSLTEYRRCGYRFYMERVLGIPSASDEAPPTALAAPEASLTAPERGVLAHALLEQLDFLDPGRPAAHAIAATARRLGLRTPENEEIADLVAGFAQSPLAQRLARAQWIRREQRFAFLLDDGPMITGILDVVAGEPGDRMLIVDYKTDRLEGLEVEQLVASAYSTQRLVYAIAALRAGATEVEVAHSFLERPDQPATATFTRAEMGRLERELNDLADAIERMEFSVTEHPCRAVCHGCPAEGNLCPWPFELTRR